MDEPTVGVDPVLRKAIWEHLDALCKEDGLTVVITTHYIEEARTAETVGLMRFGRLLVQDNPDKLLEYHGLPTLEAVFLKLCQLDSAQVPEMTKTDVMRYNAPDDKVTVSTIEMEKKNMRKVDNSGDKRDINENIEMSIKSEDKENKTDINDNKPKGRHQMKIKLKIVSMICFLLHS